MVETTRKLYDGVKKLQTSSAITLHVVLSIFLIEQGSPQSKPVDAPNSQT